MAGTFHRRFWVVLIAASAASVAWFWLPASKTDLAAIHGVARGIAKPPFFITGNGTHSAPWKLQTFVEKTVVDRQKSPLIISLGDDPEGIFQSSPPSPIDLAVIFTNFQRLGIRRASTAAVLAWETPDPMGLAALDKAISRFDSLTMAAPLSRGAAPETMPTAFRNASIPIEKVRGNITDFPIVNRIPIPGIILGGENTAAGFLTLDAEPPSQLPHLLARWGDRLVFAFPLLVAMQELRLPLNQIEVFPSSFIKLAPAGPIIPIDRHGRLTLPLSEIPAFSQIRAESIIDASESSFPTPASRPVILRDDRSSSDPATRAFSQMLSATVTAITSDSGVTPTRIYHRLKSHYELLLLGLLTLLLAGFCHRPAFTRNIIFLALAGVCIAVQYIAVAGMAIWLPGLAALAAIFASCLVSMIIPIRS